MYILSSLICSALDSMSSLVKKCAQRVWKIESCRFVWVAREGKKVLTPECSFFTHNTKSGNGHIVCLLLALPEHLALIVILRAALSKPKSTSLFQHFSAFSLNNGALRVSTVFISAFVLPVHCSVHSLSWSLQPVSLEWQLNASTQTVKITISDLFVHSFVLLTVWWVKGTSAGPSNIRSSEWIISIYSVNVLILKWKIDRQFKRKLL